MFGIDTNVWISAGWCKWDWNLYLCNLARAMSVLEKGTKWVTSPTDPRRALSCTIEPFILVLKIRFRDLEHDSRQCDRSTWQLQLPNFYKLLNLARPNPTPSWCNQLHIQKCSNIWEDYARPTLIQAPLPKQHVLFDSCSSHLTQSVSSNRSFPMYLSLCCCGYTYVP